MSSNRYGRASQFSGRRHNARAAHANQVAWLKDAVHQQQQQVGGGAIGNKAEGDGYGGDGYGGAANGGVPGRSPQSMRNDEMAMLYGAAPHGPANNGGDPQHGTVAANDNSSMVVHDSSRYGDDGGDEDDGGYAGRYEGGYGTVGSEEYAATKCDRKGQNNLVLGMSLVVLFLIAFQARSACA